MRTNQLSDFFKLRIEIFRPVEVIDRMRSERNQVGRNAKEKNVVINIIFEDFRQAIQIVLYRFDEPAFRVRFEPKSPVSFTANAPIDARIAYLHL